MAQVSRKFAEQVSSYEADGLLIPSAEGGGISQSKQSLEEGLRLTEENLRRFSKHRRSRAARRQRA